MIHKGGSGLNCYPPTPILYRIFCTESPPLSLFSLSFLSLFCTEKSFVQNKKNVLYKNFCTESFVQNLLYRIFCTEYFVNKKRATRRILTNPTSRFTLSENNFTS